MYIYGVFQKFDFIWEVLNVLEKFIWFHNLVTYPILIQKISNFNWMCRENSNFCVSPGNTYTFPENCIPIPEKKKKHMALNIEFWFVSSNIVEIYDHLNKNLSN